jgi:hypothetical protein
MPNSKYKKPRGRQRKKADFNFTRKEKRSDLEEHSPSEPDQIRPGQPAQPVRFSSLPTAPSRNEELFLYRKRQLELVSATTPVF